MGGGSWFRHSCGRFGLALVMAAALLVQAPRAHAEPAEEARILFEAGVAASRDERWREAREYFERSLALVQKPSTLFNLAVALVRLGAGAEALHALDAFDRLANPSDHAAMIERARALRREAEELVQKRVAGTSQLAELLDIPSLTGEAAALFAAGREAYWSGRYERALEYFERAHELSGDPDVLYDVGAAADRLRADERALSALEAYAKARPDAPLTPAVLARIEVLRRVIDERSKPVAPVPPPPPPATSEGSVSEPSDDGTPAPPPSLRAPRWTLGVGVSLLAIDAGLWGWWTARDRALDRCKAEGDRCTNTDTIRREREMLFIASLATGIVGAVVTIPGAVWLYRAKRANERPSIVVLTPARGIGLLVRQRF